MAGNCGRLGGGCNAFVSSEVGGRSLTRFLIGSCLIESDVCSVCNNSRDFCGGNRTVLGHVGRMRIDNGPFNGASFAGGSLSVTASLCSVAVGNGTIAIPCAIGNIAGHGGMILRSGFENIAVCGAFGTSSGIIVSELSSRLGGTKLSGGSEREVLRPFGKKIGAGSTRSCVALRR